MAAVAESDGVNALSRDWGGPRLISCFIAIKRFLAFRLRETVGLFLWKLWTTSPRKNKAFLSLRVCVCAKSLHLCLTLCDHVDCNRPGSSVHGILQARNTGMSCHALLQGIFQTQASNPWLLHCRQVLYCRATLAPLYIYYIYFKI